MHKYLEYIYPCNIYKDLDGVFLSKFFGIFIWYLLLIWAFSEFYYQAYTTDAGLELDQKSFVFNEDILSSKERSFNMSGENQAYNREVIEHLKKLEKNLRSKLDQKEKIHLDNHGSSNIYFDKVEGVNYTAQWMKNDFSNNPTYLSITMSQDTKTETLIRPHPHHDSIPQTFGEFREDIDDWIKELENNSDSYKKPKTWERLDFLYFSAVTQLTIGYGDIVPNSTWTRSLVFVQGCFSAFFMIVVVGVVSCSCNSCKTENNKKPDDTHSNSL